MSALDDAKLVADQLRDALKTPAGPDIKLMKDFQAASTGLNEGDRDAFLAHTAGVDPKTIMDVINGGDASQISDSERGVYGIAFGILLAETDEALESLEQGFKAGFHHSLKIK